MEKSVARKEIEKIWPKEKNKKKGRGLELFFGGGISQRPKQPLQLKRTFREAGLLKTVANALLLLIQCLCHESGIPFTKTIYITHELKNIV
jgi:hypothetical protein